MKHPSPIDAALHIEGYPSPATLAALYEAAKGVRHGVIVEIGSWKGRSTAALALGSRAGSKISVYAIDPHAGRAEDAQKEDSFAEFQRNMATTGVADIVIPIRKTDEEAVKEWNKPIALLFSDVHYGDGEYDALEKDWFAWLPHIADGGVIAIHNTAPAFAGLRPTPGLDGRIGPRQLVEKYIFGSRQFKNVYLRGGTTFAQKCTANSPIDRVNNTLTHLKLRVSYGWYRTYKLLSKIRQKLR